ncbi:MAG: hypothetical protein LBV43_07665 [Prevotella sp.]|jgi:hypothetical protein|nr:hypothetical protein [Prevotella sp.]
MEAKEAAVKLKQIAVEVKRLHPRLSEYECLTLATRMQKNEMLCEALSILKKKIY